jgi:hypothetical protein
MPDELDRRCEAFWSWFVAAEPELRHAFEAAIAAKDYPAMQTIVERLGDETAKVGPHIAVRLNGGKGSLMIAIQSPEPSAAESVRRLLAAAPTVPRWTFADAIQSAPKNVLVRDGSGDELTVAYADVRFLLLPPKPDGSVSVMFTIDEEFDPKGDRGHLYQAVAQEILKSTFGAVPPGMGSFALVPASWMDDRELRPVSELAERWRARAS